MTRILKAYGDALEGPETQQGPPLSKADVSSQETYLRCVVLLVRLTGKYVARFLPQVCLCSRLSAPSVQVPHCRRSRNCCCIGSSSGMPLFQAVSS